MCQWDFIWMMSEQIVYRDVPTIPEDIKQRIINVERFQKKDSILLN